MVSRSNRGVGPPGVTRADAARPNKPARAVPRQADGLQVIPPAPVQPLRTGVLFQTLGDHAEGFHDPWHEGAAALVVREVGAELVGGAELEVELAAHPFEAAQADEKGE